MSRTALGLGFGLPMQRRGETSGVGGETYSPWDVSSLPANVTASADDFRVTRSGGVDSTRVVHHPVQKSSGKFELQFRVKRSASGSFGIGVGFAKSTSLGAFAGQNADAWAVWVDQTAGSESIYHNFGFSDFANYASFTTEQILHLCIDMTTGTTGLWAGANGSFIGDPAGGTGTTATWPTTTVWPITDLYYDDSYVELLKPADFPYVVQGGFTAGWPD